MIKQVNTKDWEVDLSNWVTLPKWTELDLSDWKEVDLSDWEVDLSNWENNSTITEGVNNPTSINITLQK